MNALLNKVKDFKSKGENGGGYPKTSFLPEGNHKGRFLIDPLGELFTEYYAYGYFNKGIRDPRSLPPSAFPEGFKDELSDVVEKLKEYHWKYGAKRVFLTWFWLEDTDSKEKDRWEPHNLYCLIGNGKFASSLLNFVESMAKDAPTELQSSIDPASQGLMVNIGVTSGNQGQVQIGFSFPNKLISIDMKDQVYCTLEEAYIKPGFNQEKYNNLLKSYSEELDTYISTGAKTLAQKEAEKEAGQSPEIPDQGQGVQQPSAPQPQVQSQPAEMSQPQTAETPVQESTPSQPAVNAAPWEKFRR